MQLEKYVGITYKEKGRDTSGVDCWGLARLIYKNEYGIDLPSFASDYDTVDDTSRLQELIAQYKEGWERVKEPSEGDLVLFRILGSESHIGVAINATQFIHSRDGRDSAIERFDSPKWKDRIVGFFKYTENKSAVLNAVPNALRTERITLPIPAGTNLKQVIDWVQKEYGAGDLPVKLTVMVNGWIIPEEEWSTRLVQDSDKIEYRALPKGNKALRTVLTIAVVIAAVYTGGTVLAGMQAAGYGYAASVTTAVVASAFVRYVGMAAVDLIAPIRPPQNPGTPIAQNFFAGQANQTKQYGTIPVILGKVRFAPPLGATNYLTYENARDAYLSMLLVWGYGPITIDAATLKIGETLLTNYQDYSISTLDRKVEPTTTEKNTFDALYGKDVNQVYSGLTLVCDGNPEGSPAPGPWTEATCPVQLNAAGYPVQIASITIAIHFPQGLRRVTIKGDNSGKSDATSVSFGLEYYNTNTSAWVAWSNLTVSDNKKDGFTYTVTKSVNDYTIVNGLNSTTVRVRRLTGDNEQDNENYQYAFASILHTVTFTRNITPAEDPVGTKLAKTAFKIKATDQLNGQLEGVNAVVQTYALTWNGSSWVYGNTNNPAALFRYVLEHPANPRRVTDATNQINLTQLQYWYTYCTTKGFEYNSVLQDSRSVLDVLKDICAAGRASPILVDGKWSVAIDEEKSVVQHFTPHNSWGFEGSKGLPKIPDGLRITYPDEAQNYQNSEIIVYDIGKGVGNAELFESIQLPGVTKRSLVIDHARWHFAQAKLRPETYTLNTDIEYLVCNRGDRVKVTHDVPMWGLASGRIKNRVSTTVLDLDEQIPMKAGIQYTIRFRSKTGTSTTRTIAAKSQDGYYSQITLTSAITATDADILDMFMVGELNNESQDLIILSIEPSDSKTAKLVLVDYGVTNTYNIFTDYATLTSSTVFETQITLPPTLLIDSFGDKKPTITSFLSNETVMDVISDGVFSLNMMVSYTNAISLPNTTQSVEVQYNLNSATTDANLKSIKVPFANGSAMINNVIEAETYKVRMRYVGKDGRTGQWTAWSTHVIVGKSNPPAQVTGFGATSDFQTGKLILAWTANLEKDLKGYEVRKLDANWGVNDANRIFYGNQLSTSVNAPALNTLTTYYVKAYDYSNNFSTLATSITYITQAPANYSGTVTTTFADTSTTDSTVTFDWTQQAAGIFAIKHYELTLTKPGPVVTTVNVASNTWTTKANWIGNATLGIKIVDILGNKSALSTDTTVTKNRPNAPSAVTFTTRDGQLLAEWSPVAKTTLPIDGYEIRKNNTNWGTVDSNQVFKGAVTSTYLSFVQGTNTWYINTFDSDNVYATTPLTISYNSQKPGSVSNLVGTITDTSLTTASITFRWDVPAVTSFSISRYKISFNKAGTIITATVDSNTWTTDANWIGDGTISVTTVDVAGQESTASTLTISKQLPNNVGTITYNAVDDRQNFSWVQVDKTTLPVFGYEIRTSNANWGLSNNTNLLWRGNLNSYYVDKPTVGTYTYYIKTYDTDSNYSSVATTISFTVTKPGLSTIASPVFANTSSTGNTVTFKWTGTKNTFNIEKYQVSLTKPGNIVVSATVYGDSWTTTADWIGDATLSVTAIDVAGNSGDPQTSTITKTRPTAPATVTTTPVKNGALKLTWTEGTIGSLPIAGYELRASGTTPGTSGFIWKGTALTVNVTELVLGANSWDLWVYDTDLRYSSVAKAISYTVVVPTSTTIGTADFADSSLTSATVTLNWSEVSPEFGLRGYRVQDNLTASNTVVNSTSITLPADWIGDKTFTVKTIDNLGNESVAASKTVNKRVPNPATSFRAQVIDNNVLLYWDTSTSRTTLPIAYVQLRKGDVWSTAEVIGTKNGTFTSISELQKGKYKYWIAVADTDDNYSTEVSITAEVGQPPDFIFNKEWSSTLNGTQVNARTIESSTAIALPVNLTETFDQHFSTRSYATPQAQVTAGYPIYIQPGGIPPAVISGYYEETFDYTTVLGSSQITLNLGYTTLAGTPTVTPRISVSLDGIIYTDYDGSYSIFALNFRYIKIRVTVSQNASGDLCRINSLSLRLDAKQISDSGSISALSTDTNGTIVNFNKEVIDVTSITVSPQSTAARYAVYDFKDVVITGTYSVTSNVATINATSHGLQQGQKVRLYFTSGSATSGVYTIASVVNANSYTVAITIANTSGNVTTYPNSMTVYVYDTSGVRQSNTVSWNLRGY